MAHQNEELQLYEVGEYGSLVLRPNPRGFAVLTVPDFDSVVLPMLEQRKGRKLTRQEIEIERGTAPAIVLMDSEADQMSASRKDRDS